MEEKQKIYSPQHPPLRNEPSPTWKKDIRDLMERGYVQRDVSRWYTGFTMKEFEAHQARFDEKVNKAIAEGRDVKLVYHPRGEDMFIIPFPNEVRPTPERPVIQKRVVVCAANKLANGLIVMSARHHDYRMNQLLEFIDTKNPGGATVIEQGFVDQNGEWLSREQAHKLAKRTHQIKYRCGADEQVLYSENLYN